MNVVNQKQRLQVLQNAPPNSWVALSEDESRVIGVAATYDDAVDLAAKEGIEDPVLLKTPEEWLAPVF